MLGQPVLHSLGPGFHNPRFQQAFKDLLYLPLECGDAAEAMAALEALEILGASLTAPLKETAPGPAGAGGAAEHPLAPAGRAIPGRAPTPTRWPWTRPWRAWSRARCCCWGTAAWPRPAARCWSGAGWPCLQASRRRPWRRRRCAAFAPVGVVQATSLGMDAGDPVPFPELLEAAEPTARWAVEWIYKEDTAFAAWAREAGRRLVAGAAPVRGPGRGPIGGVHPRNAEDNGPMRLLLVEDKDSFRRLLVQALGGPPGR